MTRYLSFATEAGADKARPFLYERVRLFMLSVGEWTDGAEPISAWAAASQDARTGRWLVGSARDYLSGLLNSTLRPSANNLSGVSLGNGSAVTSAILDAADSGFITDGEPVSVARIADHYDRKTVTRNRHASGSSDVAVWVER
jgi:hypothetical protein